MCLNGRVQPPASCPARLGPPLPRRRARLIGALTVRIDDLPHARPRPDLGALPLPLTGVARSFLVLATQLVVGDSAHRAGVGAAVAVNNAAAAAAQEGAFAPRSDVESCALLSSETLASRQIAEPCATPASNLTLALYANEIVRVLMKGKSHRGDPCRHLCGVVTATEMAEPSCEEQDRPQSLLPIVDCKVDLLDDPDVPLAPLPHRRDAGLATVAIQLTVCGDAPVRLPELLDLFAREQREDGMRQTFEIVSLLCAGAARASELNDAATSVAAGSVNSSIASAKRILVGDLNTRLWCTVFQVYRVGTSNVPRSFETTAWTGAYPAAFDIGTSGGIGIRASSVTADKRCAKLLCKAIYTPFQPTQPTQPTQPLPAQEPWQDPHGPGAGGRLVPRVGEHALHAGER